MTSKDCNEPVDMLDQLKSRGNDAYAKGDYQEALRIFTQALDYDQSQHVLWSNRSATYCSMKNYSMALEDAEKAIKLAPTWAKGYSRKGAALIGMDQPEQAIKCYEEAIRLEPTNQTLQQALNQCKEASKRKEESFKSSSRAGPKPANPFASPEAMTKLRLDPRTRQFFHDPSFVRIINEISSDQGESGIQTMIKHMSDQRIMACLGVLMNVDFAKAASAEGAEYEPGASNKNGTNFDAEVKNAQTWTKSPDNNDVSSKSANESSTSVNTTILTEGQIKAQSLKEQGNEAYKAKDFDTALSKYKEALFLDPGNMTLITNQAAVFFEQGNWDECVQACMDAIDVGREHRAPFDQISKAFLRAGNALVKKADYDQAIKMFNKALAEHRTPETLARLKEVEREKEQRAKAAYFDPKLAEEEREAGNTLFKEGKFAEAVARYTESLKRNDQDPRVYSNRAACYTKLGAIPEAIKDCEQSIRLDPSFIKAYIRKANAEIMKKDTVSALKTIQEAIDRDTQHIHAEELAQIRMRCYVSSESNAPAGEGEDESKLSQEERVQRAIARDPELQQILSDPAMRLILQQMQADPKACQEHLKNPLVAAKISKLISAGIIQTR